MGLRRVLLLLVMAALLAAGLVVVASGRTPAAAAARLVPYSSCDEALAELKRAARRSVEQSRRSTDGGPVDIAPRAPASGAAQENATSLDAAAAAPAHSGTTVHEVGVDEPDLVKTDGRRIVSVTGGVLRVIDPVTHRVAEAPTVGRSGEPTAVSLHGDRALVVSGSARFEPASAGSGGSAGAALTLYDIGPAGSAARPRQVGTTWFDGDYVDARQVGSVVRVVARSQPRLRTEPAIERSTIEDWLPRYRVEHVGVTRTHTVGCERLSHPASYSGTSMLTVLSVDLATEDVGDGDPTTIVADGQTVYGTGASLYVANAAPEGQTELFKFDVTGTGRPVYRAGGEVDGELLNHYALSEHAGFLRVATTSDAGRGSGSQSSVQVLQADGDRLVTVGRVDGLGRGERIYAVRFVGPVGYVVTFRQTDPLYTVDLRDPADPRVTGELKISGYSAYLHPAGDGRLIGVGQEASAEGRIQGSQVSLFDVSDPAAPTRLARHFLPGTRSEVEVDPHAFLYWPTASTVVLPVLGGGLEGGLDGGSAALVLRLEHDGFAELGMITHPGAGGDGYAETGLIRRSLVIGDTLWTLSDAGLMAHDLPTAGTLAWVPFEPRFG